MKNVISELYYGNIDPQARGFKNGSFLKKQMAVLSESEANNERRNCISDNKRHCESVEMLSAYRSADYASCRFPVNPCRKKFQGQRAGFLGMEQ